MNLVSDTLYQDIAKRTGGSIYLGIVGPVRTGKSTFVKRMMETSVLPRIENIYQQERARDELPQCSSGRTIMTSEPKFVPEEAVEINANETTKLKIRLIDSVGYVIPGVLGVEEEGTPRMITTPWCEEEISMEEAAELGTRKIMEEHCSMGIVITTDGSINDLPRENFSDAEKRSIMDMQKTGKPFIVLVNSANPEGHEAQTLKTSLEEFSHAPCICINCLQLQESHVCEILNTLLFAFPVSEMHCMLPEWIDVLSDEHPIRQAVYSHVRNCFETMRIMSDIHRIGAIQDDSSTINQLQIINADAGNGTVHCAVQFHDHIYYSLIQEKTGCPVRNSRDLLSLTDALATIKNEYDKVSSALEEVKASGYGIVVPSRQEMNVEMPKIVRKGSNYCVQVQANAPTIHMIRADVIAQINPMVGDEKHSEEMLRYLQQEYEEKSEKLWDCNVFGKTIHDLVDDSLKTKIQRIPAEARLKLQNTLSKIINEECSGLLCLILS